ncbi:MAG: hypothetical protein KGJ28_14020 [Alphaproteobacteria bacterium]|nr:hypothetical protein [Alphaproteobacteria bacterium]
MLRNFVSYAAAVLVCTALLSGCANRFLSSEQLRAEPHQKGTVRFTESYPEVLANITVSANKCFPSKPLYYSPSTGAAASPHLVVRAIELEPGKLAKVEALTAGLGLDGGTEDVFTSLDIRSIPTGTEVDYYISRAFFGTYDASSSFVPIVTSWAHGDGTKCD